MVYLLTRMRTTRLEVKTAETLDWNGVRCPAPGLNGKDCGVLADSIKSNVMPMLHSVDFGHNIIGDIGVIATARCAVAAGMGQFYSPRLHRCGFGSAGVCGIALAAVAAVAGFLCGIRRLERARRLERQGASRSAGR